MRIGGLASGMDIDSIVGDLMKAERMPLDKLTQKKQILEWQRDDYREMNKLLTEFDEFMSVTNSDGIGKQGTFSQKIITSSDANAITAKNLTGTADINTSISVSQLAQAAYMNSAVDIRSGAFDPNAKLSAGNLAGNLAVDANGDFQFTIKSIQKDGTLSSGVDFKFNQDDSLNYILNKINSSDAGVNAFYDDKTGKVSIVAKNTGDIVDSTGTDQPEIELVDNNGTNFLTSVLKLDSDNTQNTVNNGAGKNAIFTINGLSTERASNTFTINGFEYTLHRTTSSTVSLTSTTDTDKIFDSIVQFINKYNETIDKINSKISEGKNRDYKPLTAEQKEAMSDKEVELWEKRARSGLLHNDSLLTSGLNQMRIDFYSQVQGSTSTFMYKDKVTTIDQLTDLGIETTNIWRENGKLIIKDEGKLKAAIAQNPMAIFDLFNKAKDSNNKDLPYEQKGIAKRLRQTLQDTIKNIESKAGNQYSTNNNNFAIGKTIDRVDNDINSFEDRLTQIEDRYWRQFTAMEKAIQKSNEQASYLMQQFGGGY